MGFSVKKLKLLLFILLLLFAKPLFAGYDPSLDWQELSTNHFIIYYPERLEFLAEKSALTLEKLYLDLGPLMRHYPESKVVLLITDHTDSANGSAQTSPMPIIVYYVTPATDISELMDMADRTESLLTHEYMHILQLDTVHGLPKAFNTIFGPWWSPNSIQPQWLVEGYAVYAESLNGTPGRLNSPLMTGYLRALAAAGELPKLDQITNAAAKWPYGTIPYLLGGHMINLFGELSGNRWPAAYSHLYGTSIIPYFIHTKSFQAGRLKVNDIYHLLMSELNNAAQQKEEAISARALSKSQELTANGHNKSPLVQKGEYIYFVSGNGNDDSYIYKFNLNTQRVHKVARAQSNSQLAISPADERLFFTITEWQNSFTYYNELMHLPKKRHLARHVKNAPKRLFQPVFSHDGQWLAYIINEGGTSSLWLARPDFSEQKLIKKVTNSEVFYYPQFSLDDTLLITSTWTSGGNRYFDIFRRVGETYQEASRFSPGGRTMSGHRFSQAGDILYFHADLGDETFNLFALTKASENTCNLYQISDEMAGAFYPLEVNDNIYFLKLTAGGYNLATLPKKQQEWLKRGEVPCPSLFDKSMALPLNAPQMAQDEPINTNGTSATLSQDKPQIWSKKRYSPWFTLLPRLWLPTLTQDAMGYSLGFTTSGSDILGHHNYSFSLQYGLTSYYPGVSFSYSTGFLPVDIGVSFSHYLGMGRAAISRPWENKLAHKISATALSISYPISRWRYSMSFSLNYNFNFYRPFFRERYIGESFQKISLPDDRLGRLSFYFYFSTARSFYQSLHTAKGLALSIGLECEHQALGSTQESYRLTYNYQQYQNISKLRSTLAWRLQGAFGYSPDSPYYLDSLGGPETTNIANAITSLSIYTLNYLRGFNPATFAGNSYIKGTLEWRLLLWRIQRGISTLPIYFDQLHLAFFCDAAYIVTSLKDIQNGKLAIGPGGELRLDIKLGYYVSGTLSIGFARGIGQEGANNFYILFGYLF